MTRAQTLNVLLEWVEELRGRFNLTTIDELLAKAQDGNGKGDSRRQSVSRSSPTSRTTGSTRKQGENVRKSKRKTARQRERKRYWVGT